MSEEQTSGSTVTIQINGITVQGIYGTGLVQPAVDVRCPTCKKLAFRASMPFGVALVNISYKCHHCNTMFSWP